jgi:hypothetical protein
MYMLEGLARKVGMKSGIGSKEKELINSLELVLRRLGVDAYDAGDSGFQVSVVDLPGMGKGEIAIEVCSYFQSGIYYGQLLSDILHITKSVSLESARNDWFWLLINPAVISMSEPR